ncbi:uncharacterized protein LOC131007024 [Salvia miltiorrhiza]|uniref:uncharacterized protein LOC131007024 n=1 Tax=Salvia miltiorrhiza TaxID=226208 RepID=UPI0025AD3DED|nr:uncharacterized protein LOC131007024 [Salvia miltiorrhiza]XP_057790160.1 uncharacterized protein LOC131007024 [Salvia miltiorrhiza]
MGEVMEVFLVGWINFLNEWQVRMFVILSLALQILLVLLGNRRKYVCKVWIRIIIWCAYVLADWVAVVSLGVIAKNTLDACEKSMNDKPGIQLNLFWAQFFLVHLGGPDTITAYSLEDNELWLRHLVGMLIHTGLAFYALLVAFPASDWLPYLNLLVFTAGSIKYGERVSTLCAASSENFRDSMLPQPNPGPDYAKFMERYTLKKAEGYNVAVDSVMDMPVLPRHDFPDPPGVPEAYHLFSTFKRLFAGSILSFEDRDCSKYIFQRLSEKQAFHLVEIELGFMFDELYTKASIVYNLRGCVLRMITFSLTLFAWLAFQLTTEKSNYSNLDLGITHLLLWVAICLEIYAVGALIDSDWMHRLSRVDRASAFGRAIQWFQQPIKKRWSMKVAQHNLFDLCLMEKSALLLRSIRKLTKINNHVEKHWNKSFIDVSDDLKELLFRELKSYTSGCDPAAIWSRKGSFTLEKYPSISESVGWIRKREFEERILLWHIATDICYSLEPPATQSKQTAGHSKLISEYMLYLLIVCPFMLPNGIGMIRFRDTCAEAREFLSGRDAIISKDDAYRKLRDVDTQVPPAQVKGDRSKSVLFDACILAKSLLEEKVQRWEIISKVWVEMLAYAATNCGGNQHARQLRKGGELLTHVWLLMAHLGITEQFQISQGHARAKILVK